MIITITGTPGTGKTTVAEELSIIMKMKIAHLNEIIKKEKLYERYDRKYKSYEVDPKKIKKIKIEDGTIVEGHLSHFIKSDVCIVLRCAPDVLKKRLKKKRWSTKKIYENLAAEILDIIEVEAEEQNKNVLQIDTTKTTPKSCANKIKRYIKTGKSDNVKWLIKFEKYLIE